MLTKARGRGILVCCMLMGCAHSKSAAPAREPAGAEVAAPPPVAIDVPDAESDARTLRSKVSKVTVYSDRARVSRQAAAEVASEPVVFAFRSLPGWVDDGSVQVSTSAGRIVDVRVDRRFLAKATDASWRQLEAEHKLLTDKLAALRDELAVLEAQRAQIESIKPFSLAKIGQDTVLGELKVKSYAELVAFISESLRATATARRAVQGKLDELTPEHEASQRRLEDAKGLMKLEETTVLVTLQASQPTTATLELTYMLPGVTWEPMHELRASTKDGKSVEVLSFAAVSQTSGEDWGGATLSFSTQSTTQSVNIPELQALTLGDTHSATRVLTEQVSSFTRAQAAFAGQSSLWNKLHGPSGASQVHSASAERARASFEQVFRSNVEYMQVVQGRTVSIFESLERRGTTAHYQAQPATSVRGDGHPVRLLIGRSVLASSPKTVAAPEQSLNAAHTLAMTNSTGLPFLPGKVARYQDGTFLGMTDIDFTANGERFSLFLSVADHIKISRQLDRKLSTLVRRTRSQMQAVFIVKVENLSTEATSFTLADRVPVSENKEIHIDRVSISPSVKPDSQGLLHWDLTLKPGEKREFRISYQVEYPAELVLETRRQRAAEPASPAARPAKMRSKIEDQILDLEDAFQ